VKRLLFDLIAFGLLLALDSATALPALNSVLVALAIPGIVGFMRGLAEYRILHPSRPWWGTVEWAAVIFVEYTLSCYLGVLSHPVDNFETVFGFGLLILLAPSELLGIVTYWSGVTVARRAKP
jgi:hypothetical protein